MLAKGTRHSKSGEACGKLSKRFIFCCIDRNNKQAKAGQEETAGRNPASLFGGRAGVLTIGHRIRIVERDRSCQPERQSAALLHSDI